MCFYVCGPEEGSETRIQTWSPCINNPGLYARALLWSPLQPFYQTLKYFSELIIPRFSITERFGKETAAAAAARLPDLGPSPLTRVQPQHEFIGTKAAFHHRHTADISFRPTPQFNGGSDTRARSAGVRCTWRRIAEKKNHAEFANYIRHDAPSRAETTPTVSPLSLRPHLHRKMAFEQRAIFPMLTG